MKEQFTEQLYLSSYILLLRYFVLCGLIYLLFYVVFKTFFVKKKLQSTFPKTTDYRPRNFIFYNFFPYFCAGIFGDLHGIITLHPSVHCNRGLRKNLFLFEFYPNGFVARHLFLLDTSTHTCAGPFKAGSFAAS